MDAVFANPSHFSRLGLLCGVLGYTLQIWGDFSGYTDMGRGAAKMLGIHLPENFLAPYLAKSPSEFWKRWHVTLSQWIRDYIYIPLGGSRGSRMRIVLVAFVTMGIAGLWHGPNWTFIVWGLFHGGLLVGERIVRWSSRIGEGQRNLPFLLSSFLPWLGMQSLVALGWLCFRAPSLGSLGQYLISFGRGGGMSPQTGLPSLLLASVLCLLCHGIGYYDLVEQRYPVVEHFKSRFDVLLERRMPATVWGAAAGCAFAILFIVVILLQITEASRPFIYFQF